jgi:hypothetical protein
VPGRTARKQRDLARAVEACGLARGGNSGATERQEAAANGGAVECRKPGISGQNPISGNRPGEPSVVIAVRKATGSSPVGRLTRNLPQRTPTSETLRRIRSFGADTPASPREAAVSAVGMRSRVWRRSVEDCQVELLEPLAVGEEVELDDLSVPHRDDADREGVPVAEGDGPGNAVDQRRPYVQLELA